MNSCNCCRTVGVFLWVFFAMFAPVWMWVLAIVAGIVAFVGWMSANDFSTPRPKQPKTKLWHGDLLATLDHWIMGEEFFRD